MADYRQEMIGPLMQRMGVGRPPGTATGMGMTPPPSRFINPALQGLNQGPSGQLPMARPMPMPQTQPQGAMPPQQSQDQERARMMAQRQAQMQMQTRMPMQQNVQQIMQKYGMGGGGQFPGRF